MVENKIAYKGFNVDENNRLYCCPHNVKMYYEVDKEIQIGGELKLCSNGIHFCWNLNDVHAFYNLHDNVICKIEVLGDIINETDMEKSCTNKIKIIEILTKEKVLSISNIGKDNTGIINTGNRNAGNRNTGNRNTGDMNAGNRNTGDMNTGNWNTGDMNTGNWNTGDMNTGDMNTSNWNTGDRNTGNRNAGNRNTGNRNTGDMNTGNRNTGDMNTGNWNTGDMNTGNMNTGWFNTNSPKIRLFNLDTDMTFEEFFGSEFYRALQSTSFMLTEWINYTYEEKENDKAKELIGGYLKSYPYKEACKKWWEKKTNDDKEIIKNIPNFNADIFFEITGIKV